MAINKKLIHFKTKAAFTTELNAGNILDTSIVFIKDTKEIWTHGQLYSCSLTEEEVISIIENSSSISNLTSTLNNKVDKVPRKSLVDDTEIDKLSNLPNKADLDSAIADAKKAGTDAQTNLTAHIGNKENPHEVTKVQVGLGNVTNDAQVKRSEMGAASGVATLDSNGIIPYNQLPTIADDEDLIEVNNRLKLKDKVYDPDNFSGKGYVILRKNIVEGKNILTQDMINESNTMYEIRYDFDLDSAIINMPYNSFLLFKGGTIINGTILNLKQEVCPEDFGAKGDGIADDYAAVLMAINSSNTINFKGSYNFKGKTLLLEKKQNFLIFNRSNTEYNIINGTIKLGGSLKFITIDGIRINNSNKLEYGIFAEGNVNILRLKNLYVTKCSTAGISLVNCYDCYISKCSCTSNNIGLYMKNCFSSNVIKSNAYYNNIGVKVDGDASTNYNMTIQENLYTGFEGLSIVACTLNLYLEQNGYNGTNNKEKSQIYLGSLPFEETTKGCLCRLYCVGGKGSEMESPYNLYLNGASSNLIVGSYYRSTVTDIYISSSYNTNNIVLSNKGASVVNENPSNKINNEVPNKDSDDLSIGEYIFTSKPYFKSANGLIDCFGNSSTFKAVDNYANRPNGVSGSVFLNKDKSYTPSICINGSDYIDVQPIIHSTDTKNVLIGTLCYDLKKKRIAAFNGDIFVATNGFNINFNINGATEDRPTLNQEHSGFQYYDTTLKKYIVWNGTEWTSIDGTDLDTPTDEWITIE